MALTFMPLNLCSWNRIKLHPGELSKPLPIKNCLTVKPLWNILSNEMKAVGKRTFIGSFSETSMRGRQRAGRKNITRRILSIFAPRYLPVTGAFGP
jgi:hypothetical protein